jgi:hypothetical protein
MHADARNYSVFLLRVMDLKTFRSERNRPIRVKGKGAQIQPTMKASLDGARVGYIAARSDLISCDQSSVSADEIDRVRRVQDENGVARGRRRERSGRRSTDARTAGRHTSRVALAPAHAA